MHRRGRMWGDDDKVVVITGGSRGIGRATALASPRAAFAWWSATPAMSRANEVVGLIEGKNGKAIAVKCDVGSEPRYSRTVRCGGRFRALGALVNNAGIVGASRVADMSAERIQRMMAVNVTGSILCAREAVKRMSTRKGGKGGVIVNLSSVAARTWLATTYVDYAASKGASTRSPSASGRSRRRGHPRGCDPAGLIDTEIHASGGEPDRAHRLAHGADEARRPAEEIANAIVWLMSDEASYVTSATLDVSGGR